MRKKIFIIKIFCLLFLGILICWSAALGELLDNGDGTITDTDTDLMWQQGENPMMKWESALEYCENLVLAGYNDWRMPNRNELQTIIFYHYQVMEPAIDTTIFPDVSYPADYWTST